MVPMHAEKNERGLSTNDRLQIRMTNDESRMTKAEWRKPNGESRMAKAGDCAAGNISTFGLRISF
jgi:hypothetical protein